MQLDVALNRRHEVMRIEFVFRVSRTPQVGEAPTTGHGFDEAVATDSRADIKLAHAAASVPWLKQRKLVLLSDTAAFHQAVESVANFQYITVDLFTNPRA